MLSIFNDGKIKIHFRNLERKKKILMLGWEFPPVFTGGLGIACYNIVKELSSKASVHLIVPQSGEQNELDTVEVTGLNWAARDYKDVQLEFPEVLLSRISVNLSAYPSVKLERTFTTETATTEDVKPISSWEDLSSYFQKSDLYGSDILQRTQLFAMTVQHLTANENFDIIHAHDWPTFEAAVELKHQTHKPLILHIHSLETDRAGETARNEIYAIEKMAMEEAEKIIAVSNYTKNEIAKNYDVDEKKIEVAHNGAEVTRQSSFQKKASEKWVTFVGRLTFQKGPQFLVETARKLIRVYPNVRFIIAGAGDLFPSLIHEVAKERLGRYFSFTGFLSREKIKDLLASSDAYFMPSVSEPFGLSALEAVQQGTASVISRRSGAAEVLNHSPHADFWDTDKFANYLYAILRYPKLKSAIELQSLKDVEQLTWDKTTEKIMDVYNVLMP